MRLVAIHTVIIAAVAVSTSYAQQLTPTDPPITFDEMGVDSDDDYLLVFVDEPASYLDRAYDRFLLDDAGGSARALRKAAAYVSMRSRGATGELRKAMRTSAKELRELAGQLLDGKALPQSKLEDVFARVEYRMAVFHFARAIEFREKGETEKMAYATEAAAAHLLEAAFWMNEDLDVNDALAARETRTLARKVAQGADSGVTKLNAGIRAVGGALKKIAGNRRLGPLPDDFWPRD